MSETKKPLINKKRYSYLMLLSASFLITVNATSVNIEIYDNKTKIVIASREIPPQTFIPTLIIIASALGLDVERLAGILNINKNNQTSENKEEE
jgi:hypothetical protein